MFQDELTLYSDPRQVASQMKSVIVSGQTWRTQSEIEYEICRSFMRQTGRQLSCRESALIASSQQLLEAYACHRKKQIESSRTLDTMLEESSANVSLSIEEERHSSSRRSLFPFSSRKQILFGDDFVKEIQQNCSYGCSAWLTSLLAEYKKLENKIKSYQSKELTLLKREQISQRYHEQNILLKRKMENSERTIRQLNTQIGSLKEQNKSITSCINDKINSISANHKYFQINHRVYKDIKNYLAEKEVLLKQLGQRLDECQMEVLGSIEDAFPEDTCSKCCEILKKIKDSIIKYKKYLEEQATEFQKLYDKYKRTMYSTKARPPV